ncbi:MAG: GTP-binding protein [Acidimicrobiales bacterium]
MALLWDGTRVPVTLIGGILGSGKTTLLNRLLADAGGRRLVVLVNDVGDLAIDATPISSVRDDVIELTNGCVCCSMTDGLGEALRDDSAIAARPDHDLVELSGVAEPHRVAPWASTPGFRLDAIVVCVDAERIGHQLADRWLADTVRAQLPADLIVLTKTDLVDRPPSLPRPHHSAGPRRSVAGARSAILSGRAIGVPVEFDEHLGTSRWTVSSIRLPDPIDPERFADRLADLLWSSCG